MMPLYLSLLFKVMKAQGTHEGCIEQVYGLYRDSLYGDSPRMDSEAVCAQTTKARSGSSRPRATALARGHQ
jgi:enoyl-[acyl-carrier protein] reductase/trans-2-enoyl-CoA reductase (NAD+)